MIRRYTSTLAMTGPTTRPKLGPREDGWLGMSPGSMGSLDLEQGSLEWALERSKYVTATDVAGIVGEAKYGPNTLQKVLDKKRGKTVQSDSPAMAHGRDMEPVLRAVAQGELGVSLPPAVLTRGRLLASLDGWDPDTRTLLEIKTSFAAAEPPTEVPEHYIAQLATQAWVCAPSRVFYLHHAGDEVALIEVDRAYLLERFLRCYAGPICEAYEHLVDGTDPEPERHDEEWRAAALTFALAHANAEGAERRLSDAREALLALSGGSSAHGEGVRVSWQERQGNVNWKAKPILTAIEAAGVDLEQYRGKTTRYAKVEVLK